MFRLFTILCVATVAILEIEGKWDMAKTWPQLRCHPEYKKNPDSYANRYSEECYEDEEAKKVPQCHKACIMSEGEMLNAEHVNGSDKNVINILDPLGVREIILQEFGKWNRRHELKHTSEKGQKKAAILADKVIKNCDSLVRQKKYKSTYWESVEDCLSWTQIIDCIDDALKC